MFKEVAFDPKCLNEFSYYTILTQNISFDTGRFISACPFLWAQEAMESVKHAKMQNVKRQSIKNFIIKVRQEKVGHFITAPNRTSYSRPWLSWVKKENENKAFDTIITSEVEKVTNSINDLGVSSNDASWNNPISRRIKRDENEIVDALKTMIQSSSRFTMIDQYLQINCNPIIDKLLEFLSKNESIKELFLVTASCTNDPMKGFNSEYGKYKDLPKITIVKANPKYFHDRFAISEFGAIYSGQGFSLGGDEGTPTEFLKWGFISYVDANIELESIEKAVSDGCAIKYVR
jgi:hypothetical protein